MDNHTKTCKFCQKPVIPDWQTSFTGKQYALYTCRNENCRAGALEITLCADSFDALDVTTLESYERGVTFKAGKS